MKEQAASETSMNEAFDTTWQQSQSPTTRSRSSSQSSGSNYSRPETPVESRVSLKLPEKDTSTSSDIELQDVVLDLPSDKASRELQPTAVRPLRVSSYIAPRKSEMEAASRRTWSIEGWNYEEAMNVEQQRSPDTPALPVSPVTPREGHMSMASLQSLSFAEAMYGDPQVEEEQTVDLPPTPTGYNPKRSTKASSLEMLENVWLDSFSEAPKVSEDRPPPPRRQSTLFDMSKDKPLTPTTPTTPTSYAEKEEEGTQTEQISGDDETFANDKEVALDQHQLLGSSLAVADPSSNWQTARVNKRTSSLFAPVRISDIPNDNEIMLDWSTLDKTEEQEKADKDLPEGIEDESTQFLLARLEQENAKFTADPKVSTTNRPGRARTQTQTRPPSMAQLKKLMSQQDAPSIRYSLVSEAEESVAEEPLMTELEFWLALVQDKFATASRLPTLTTTKIRAGVPPPLRGVVWTSMAGARDADLEEAFERLKDEESAFESIINKDVGRSFPGVELFRDAEGEGQKMLSRVLKCFSLHDKDIGYCQGLGFLVGPLLMNMGEKDAFCVLVRLMEHYALRASFLPSLSGLHMRIFQFSVLLKQHHPALAAHLSNLGVEPAYLSQWFLSLFAVTCPLDLLFRIYDVIFAEGANETVMRVALSLFRRNEQKMMESEEFEDVMELLLGRQLWDVYGCNADELVDDFTSLGHIITHARLTELEREFETKGSDAVGQSAGFLPDVQAAASRFLGRLWAPTHNHTPSKAGSTLAPQSAEQDGSARGYLSRPVSFLRRSPSKQDISIVNDTTSSDSSGSSGSASITSTAPTEPEIRDSRSMKSRTESVITVSGSISGHAQQMSTVSEVKEQELQTEIEDLLMALSEMQREHAQMVAMLQREREERSDDHRVVRQLLSKITNGESDRKILQRRSMPPAARSGLDRIEETKMADKRKTMPAKPRLHIRTGSAPVKPKVEVKEENKEGIEGLVDQVQGRLEGNARFSATFETRAQLRSALSRTREQLATAETQVKELGERAETAETSLAAFQAENDSLLAEAEELRSRVNDDFKEKQKLELKIENMQIQMRMEAKALEKKQRTASLARTNSSGEVPLVKMPDSPSRSRTGSLTSNPGNAAGLRDLKLGRRDSVGSVASIRSSLKSQRQTEDEWPVIQPPPLEIPSSPPKSPQLEVTPTERPLPAIPLASSLSVPAPSGPAFARRTTSLVTKEVFATPQHEAVPEEALLLELVNAKTAEATARQELDEIRRSMRVQKDGAERTLLELEAKFASAKMEAELARQEAEQARLEAKEARAEVFDASLMNTPVTPGGMLPLSRGGERFPVNPGGNGERSRYETPQATTPPSAEAKEPDSGSSWLVGWNWSKSRALSASKLPSMRSSSGDK